MGFNTINFHCNVISGVKDKGNDTDIIYTFNLINSPGYMINIIPTFLLYQKVTKEGLEYIEFHVKSEQGRPTVFNGDVLSFTLHFVYYYTVIVIFIVMNIAIDKGIVISIDIDKMIAIDKFTVIFITITVANTISVGKTITISIL